MLEDVGAEKELEEEGFEDTGLEATIGQLDLSSGPSHVTTSSAGIPTPNPLQATVVPSGEVFTPGVESMTRCVLGSTGFPAQWPDSCHLEESIFVQLCDIHKSPKKGGL
ncbi:unnamed protein product [Lota lota]